MVVVRVETAVAQPVHGWGFSFRAGVLLRTYAHQHCEKLARKHGLTMEITETADWLISHYDVRVTGTEDAVYACYQDVCAWRDEWR